MGVVFGIYWASQFIEFLLPFSFPASVISLILMLILLLTGLIKLEQVKEFSDLMLGNLVFLFVPVSVGIMNYVGIISQNMVAFITICVVSLILTYAATSFAVQMTRKLMEKKEADK
jgi:holin-like protein